LSTQEERQAELMTAIDGLLARGAGDIPWWFDMLGPTCLFCIADVGPTGAIVHEKECPAIRFEDAVRAVQRGS
jgi:hypothetical protein